MKDQSEQLAIDALYRISSIVSTTEDLSEALEIIIDEIMHVLPSETASIEIINPDKNSLEVEAYRGFPKDVTETVLKVGAGVTGWVALHGRPVNIGDVRKDARYIEIDKRIRSELAVPMRTETGMILGVVNIDSFQKNAFSEQHVKILTLLAAEATRGLSRLWLIQQLRQTADHLEVLIDIAQSVVNKRQLDEILGIITSRSKEISPCTLSAIFLREGDERQLSLKASSGPEGPLDYTETIFLEQSSIGTAFSRRKTIEIMDLPRIEENHFRELIAEYHLASMLSCPIQFEDEVIGVLNIYTDHPHRFNDGEKRIFETLANLSAAAILNAQLYQRVFQSEEKLRRSEKLTTLGLLSSEIAHEIRNPLTVIQLLFESLTLEFEEGDPRQKDVAIIHEKLEQLEVIVSRVLSFGKSRQEMHSRYELPKLIEDTLHLVRLKLRQGKVNVSYACETSSPLKVDVNKGQIQQALLNLILNAAQALPKGGSIDISATSEQANGQNWAVVRIRDNGSGIDPAIQDSIFDSFLTGRPDGTGLGLSIVKRILKSHKGSVTVEESGPEGTTMKLLLPLAG
ncbi:GAF domain-containing protein [Puniceicoccales bacterium CK1056]|uniref:histidine kinase n=1 Tax=Oceanipulchritudo coccoides TaxID=2706888 RepID=A0A6B2M0Y5_9BACT|nr:GAF domain-containing protein [Oceanipulchritudo coccoides]NDV62373.1 GAF domain-containing protein [Oceanipulchritudo coccoides]